MRRAKATALALVNWKGVFYERYLLDRNVTALEGANGAGKTTVMVAAYVVLMPDMTRLRFSNVGEGSGSGGDKGIYGRLGEPGRPSFAALEVELEHSRVVLGVCLVRRSDPTVELTPFLVSGLDLQGRLKELLLTTEGGEDAIPTLDHVVATATALGGKVDVFSSAKDYFTALFDLGITPLRLASDEDRSKLNEMLRTSMTGGISKAITGELRSFLLREEPGLSDTLTQMRGNLDACHRTRAEVAEARVLERELSAVHDAARSATGAAIAAARALSLEAERRATTANVAADEATLALRDLEREAKEIAATKDVVTSSAAVAKARAEEARGALDAAIRGKSLTESLAIETEKKRGLEENHRVSGEALVLRVREREATKASRDRAREAYDRSARGLADVQAGLDDLHTSAQASRRLRSSLAEATTHLGRLDPIDSASIERELTMAREGLARIDERRVRLERDLSTSDVRRSERARALEALRAISPRADGDLLACAREVLRERATLEAKAARVDDLADELESSERLASRQVELVALARTEGFEAPAVGLRAKVEAARRTLEDRLTELQDVVERGAARGVSLSHSAEAARERATALETVRDRYHTARALARGLEEILGASLGDNLDPHLARVRLDEARAKNRDALRELEARRDSLTSEADRLERAGGTYDRELLRLRDELDGELFALRFEDLELDDAARKEASLGALSAALVVDAPERAIRSILGKPRSLDTILLVRPDAEALTATIVGESGGDVVIAEPYGLRITRLPTEPSLGSRARKKRAARVREDAGKLAKAIAEARAQGSRLDEAHRALDTLFVDSAILEAGDPTSALATAREAAVRTKQEAEAAREGLEKAKLEAAEARKKLEPLRILAGEGVLLEPPDHDALKRTLGKALVEARAARHDLARLEKAYVTLSELTHALDGPALDDDRAREEKARLETERDRSFRAVLALDAAAQAAREVLHPDAERLLSERSAIVPALEETHAHAKDEAARWDMRMAEADASWEAAAHTAREAELGLTSTLAEVTRHESDLAALGTGLVDDTKIDLARRALAEARESRDTLSAELERTILAHAVLTERLVERARAHAALVEQAERETASHTPARALAEELSREAHEAGAPVPETQPNVTPAALFAQARGMDEVLADRLARSRGGVEIAERVRVHAATDDDETFARNALGVWTMVVEWLRRRLPMAISSLPDPSAALLRLHDDLASLETRLGHQESSLRGTSEDVARGIDVQLRRAKAQVRRLNQTLSGVHFGNIAGIRIQMTREPRMDQVLAALRDGTSQEILFDPRMPVEEALAEIFKRYAGGKSGSQRILDYREYLELSVDVQRTGKTEWEAASPSRLSTGEGIGVGAAILMVILTEWERDGNLLRARRPVGSMRFLFLDEANRLSQDNLATLFDLCESLELQLLVAAPEVARADGNTTYRLVRRADANGREEVIVSGRRALRDDERELAKPNASEWPPKSEPSASEGDEPDETNEPDETLTLDSAPLSLETIEPFLQRPTETSLTSVEPLLESRLGSEALPVEEIAAEPGVGVAIDAPLDPIEPRPLNSAEETAATSPEATSGLAVASPQGSLFETESGIRDESRSRS